MSRISLGFPYVPGVSDADTNQHPYEYPTKYSHIFDLPIKFYLVQKLIAPESHHIIPL